MQADHAGTPTMQEWGSTMRTPPSRPGTPTMWEWGSTMRTPLPIKPESFSAHNADTREPYNAGPTAMRISQRGQPYNAGLPTQSYISAEDTCHANVRLYLCSHLQGFVAQAIQMLIMHANALTIQMSHFAPSSRLLGGYSAHSHLCGSIFAEKPVTKMPRQKFLIIHVDDGVVELLLGGVGGGRWGRDGYGSICTVVWSVNSRAPEPRAIPLFPMDPYDVCAALIVFILQSSFRIRFFPSQRLHRNAL